MKRTLFVFILLPLTFGSRFAEANIHTWHKDGNNNPDSLTLQIQIGKPIPDIRFDNIINYKTRSANIADFRGKYIILDFWATFCSPCIALMPKMEQFQKQFGNKLQIMMVALQSKKTTENFYRKREESGRPIGLPSVMDSSLAKFFGIRFIPHYVWIDKTGIIKAITDNNHITEENIRRFINGEELNLPVKADPVAIRYDYDIPLLVNGNGGSGKNLKYHSILSGYIEGLGGAYSLNADSCKIVGLNCTIPGLYLIAYGDNNSALPTNRLNLEVRDSSKYIPDLKNLGDWQKDNLYCYELIVPDSLAQKRLTLMREDLKRTFGLEAKFEKIYKDCLVLIATREKSIITQSKEPERKISPTGIKIQNMPITSLIGAINHYHPKHIFLDETGYSYNIDIQLEGDITDLDSLRESLQLLGLDIIKSKREVNVLTLFETNN